MNQVAPNNCANFVAGTALSIYLDRSKTAREIEITLKKIFYAHRPRHRDDGGCGDAGYKYAYGSKKL